MSNRTHSVRVVGVVLVALTWTACNDRRTDRTCCASDHTRGSPSDAHAHCYNRQHDVAAIGATSQLTATATLSDGTTKDVTSEARWARATL